MGAQAFLYDADGSDREVDLDALSIKSIGENQLLWIDLDGDTRDQISQLDVKLPITTDMIRRLVDEERPNHLDNYGNIFAFRVEIPTLSQSRDADGPSDNRRTQSLSFIVAQQWLLTQHSDTIEFLTAFRAQDKGETLIGSLSPSLLAASLLDWYLAEFFSAASRIEGDVDKIDERILTQGAARNVLLEIVRARRLVSELRSLIARQRSIFHGLTRPDFALNTDEQTTVQFKALADRYDRAVDEVEHAREVVIGTFDLFTSMSSEETNDLVKGLTFVTVVIGFSAAVAGVLGMNFDAPFFKSGLTGFIVATSSLAALLVVSIVIAKWRKWI
jgi:magnesium transporter